MGRDIFWLNLQKLFHYREPFFIAAVSNTRLQSDVYPLEQNAV
jgi:MoxR-like ATPase